MPLSTISFTTLILFSALLYFYSSWKLIHLTTPESSSEITSPLSTAKPTLTTFLFMTLRAFSPLLALVGIGWGFYWITLHHGFFSFWMGVFILGLGLGYLGLKVLLMAVLIQFLQKIHPKKR